MTTGRLSFTTVAGAPHSWLPVQTPTPAHRRGRLMDSLCDGRPIADQAQSCGLMAPSAIVWWEIGENRCSVGKSRSVVEGWGHHKARGQPERREKNKALWTSDDWRLFLANLYAPPRVDPSPSSTPIPITQTIYTDLDAIRQQLLPHHQWTIYDNHDDAVLGTLSARLLLARSRNYRRTRDQYRLRRGAPPKWRGTSSMWASHIWRLPETSLRRRGTSLKTIWDQWWHGENQWIAGAPDGACRLCKAPICSQAHILCVCPVTAHIRQENLLSIKSATQRLPPGPSRHLASTFLDIATS